jgi:hypothetical protein
LVALTAGLTGFSALGALAAPKSSDEAEALVYPPVSEWSDQFVRSIHDYLYLIYIGAAPAPPDAFPV